MKLYMKNCALKSFFFLSLFAAKSRSTGYSKHIEIKMESIFVTALPQKHGYLYLFTQAENQVLRDWAISFYLQM